MTNEAGLQYDFSRIDVIGQNGNDGAVYEENVCMHCSTYLKVPDNWWQSWHAKGTAICIPCGRKQNKRNDTPDKARDRSLRRKYGINHTEYINMLLKQEGKCAICGTLDPGGPPQTAHFSVDHCHATGQVRKLLCNNCNTAIGMFSDNAETMRKAAAYVEEFHDVF